MKIKATYTFGKKNNTVGLVDRWRVRNPFQELEKNTDWEIDYAFDFLINAKQDANYIQKQLDDISKYDVVWSSYYTNKMMYAFVKLAESKSKTKFVMDVDDDIYRVPSHNPFWFAMNQDRVEGMQAMVETCTTLVTTNERLARQLRSHRKGLSEDSVIVLPNYISRALHEHPEYDNGDVVKIGYFGGASHYGDLNNTKFGLALSLLMKKYRNVQFELYGWWGSNKRSGEIVGSLIEAPLEKKRCHFQKGVDGDEWYDLFNSINLDIACGPLEDTEFNEGKSDIKWQESSLMGACFIASNVGPYRDTIRNGVDGVLVDNSLDNWYDALEALVLDKAKRKELAKNAKQRVLKDFTIENNWKAYKDAIERITQ